MKTQTSKISLLCLPSYKTYSNCKKKYPPSYVVFFYALWIPENVRSVSCAHCLADSKALASNPLKSRKYNRESSATQRSLA